MRFDVRYPPAAAPVEQAHEGPCLLDEEHDGPACCPLGEVDDT